MAFLEKLAYQVGVDTDAAAQDFTRIQRMIDGLGEQAKKTFDRDIGRSLANSIDPKNLESDLAKAKNVLARFGKDASDTFNKTLGRNVARSLTSETSKFTEQLKATLGQSFSLKNLALGSAAGLGIASLASSLLEAGKAAVSFAADFELALAQVESIADDGFNTQAVGKDLKALAQQVPQDLISLTKGLGDIIGSGVTEASDALKVLEISAKAAVAGLTDTATSSRGIVFVLNAYGKSAEEAAGVSDILFKTVDEGVIKFGELTNVIGDVAGPAAQAGIEFGEIGAAIAFLTKQGISGAEATTALRNLITRIIDPADSAKAAAKALGIELSLAGLKAAGGFTEFIAQIRQATGGDITKLQAIFPEERSFRAASRLAGEVGGEFQRLSGIFTDVAQTAGATEKAFNIINQTADQQWKLFKNNLSVATLELGESILESLTPALRSLNESFAGLTEADKTINRLEKLGVAGQKLDLLKARSEVQKTQSELRDLQEDLDKTINRLATLGQSSGTAAAFNAPAFRDAVIATGKEFNEIIKTQEGVERASNRLVSISDELLTINSKIVEIQTGKIVNAEDELNSLEQQRLQLEGQQSALQDLLIATNNIKEQEEELKNKKLEEAKAEEQLVTNAQQRAKLGTDAVAAQEKQKQTVLDIRKLSLEQLQEQLEALRQNKAENGELIKQIEKEIEGRKKSIELQKQAAEFIANTRKQIELLSADSDTQKQIIQIRQQTQERIKMFGAQSEAAKVALEFETAQVNKLLEDRLEGTKKYGEELAKLRTGSQFEQKNFDIEKEFNESKAALDELKAATLEAQDIAAADRAAKLAQIEQREREIAEIRIIKEQEVQAEISATIEKLNEELMVASAPTELQGQIAAIKFRYEAERKLAIKNFGERSEQVELINKKEQGEFKKTLKEFEDGLQDFEKKRFREFLLQFDVDGNLDFEKFFKQSKKSFDDATGKTARDFEQAFNKIFDVFDTFEAATAAFGIKLNEDFVNVVHGFANIGNSALSFSKALTGSPVDIINSGLQVLGSIGGLLGVFGNKRDLEKERQIALEEQRQKAEEAKRAIEEFNQALEETRRATEGAALARINSDLAAVNDEIRAITALNRAITKEEFERYFALQATIRAVSSQIQGFLLSGLAVPPELLEQLRAAQNDFNALGFSLSSLSAEQIESLRLLVGQQEVYNNAIKEFGGIVESFTGSMDRLNLAFDLFDIEDPIKKLEAFTDEIKKRFGADLPTTLEGIDDFVRRGFEAFSTGGQALVDFLTAMNLEELTADEFLDLLRTLEGFGDEIDETVTPGIAKSLDDLLEKIQKEFDLLEIKSPQEKLARFAEDINKSFGASFFTNEGELRSFVNQGVAAFIAGGEQLKEFLAYFNLEELTAPEFETLLQSFKELLGEFDAAVQAQFDDIFSDLGIAADFLGEDDPALKLEKLRARLNDEFDALIPDTEEQIRAFIQQGALALIQGGDAIKAFLASVGLEEITQDKLEELLRAMQGFVEDLNAEADHINDIKEDKLGFGEVKTITFQQGNRFIDEVISMRVILTQMLDVMRTGNGFDVQNAFSALSGLRPGEARNHFYFINGGAIREVDQNSITPAARAMMEAALSHARANGQV